MIEFPEFRLAVECCRSSFRNDDRTDDLAVERVDWDVFLRLVQFHRIEGLAWKALSASRLALPEVPRSQLASASMAIGARSLGATAECRSLLERFAAANVPLLFLKGLT